MIENVSHSLSVPPCLVPEGKLSYVSVPRTECREAALSGPEPGGQGPAGSCFTPVVDAASVGPASVAGGDNLSSTVTIATTKCSGCRSSI